MTAITSSILPAVSTQTLTGYDVAKIVLVDADTEYSYTLPSGTLAFAIQNRNDGAVHLRKTSGGDHWTFFAGQPWFPVNMKSSASITLILSSPQAAQTVEVLYWS